MGQLGIWQENGGREGEEDRPLLGPMMSALWKPGQAEEGMALGAFRGMAGRPEGNGPRRRVGRVATLVFEEGQRCPCLGGDKKTDLFWKFGF